MTKAKTRLIWKKALAGDPKFKPIVFEGRTKDNLTDALTATMTVVKRRLKMGGQKAGVLQIAVIAAAILQRKPPVSDVSPLKLLRLFLDFLREFPDRQAVVMALEEARIAQKTGTPKKRPPIPFAATSKFLNSFAWRRMRMEVLTERGAKCECCGATPDHGARMCVDHVKPRKLYPELALEKSNLQVLCGECNHGKGNWDETDWRKAQLAPRLAPSTTKGAQF